MSHKIRKGFSAHLSGRRTQISFQPIKPSEGRLVGGRVQCLTQNKFGYFWGMRHWIGTRMQGKAQDPGACEVFLYVGIDTEMKKAT